MCHIPVAYNLERRWEFCLWSYCATSKVVQDNVLEAPPGCTSVYTDIVTGTVIEDVTAPLLAILSLPAKQAPAKFTPAQMAYHRVKVRQLTNISIKLADLNGKDIDFYGNETIVLVEIHFRCPPVKVYININCLNLYQFINCLNIKYYYVLSTCRGNKASPNCQ